MEEELFGIRVKLPQLYNYAVKYSACESKTGWISMSQIVSH